MGVEVRVGVFYFIGFWFWAWFWDFLGVGWFLSESGRGERKSKKLKWEPNLKKCLVFFLFFDKKWPWRKWEKSAPRSRKRAQNLDKKRLLIKKCYPIEKKARRDLKILALRFFERVLILMKSRHDLKSWRDYQKAPLASILKNTFIKSNTHLTSQCHTPLFRFKIRGLTFIHFRKNQPKLSFTEDTMETLKRDQ